MEVEGKDKCHGAKCEFEGKTHPEGGGEEERRAQFLTEWC